jgi:5'-nucleotidase
MPGEKPLILLSNDDGFRAVGLGTLRDVLREVADVVVCAPETEQSVSSHALTLTRPLRLRDHGGRVFSVDGTPADCVYVAINAGTRVLPRRPDVVVSGLNHGLNLGTDDFYSGTVAAAREGALRGYPALAVSAAGGVDLRAAAVVVRRLALGLLEEPSRAALFNVNFPPGSAWPVTSTCLGTRLYTDAVDFRRDPRGNEYLWLGGPGAEHRPKHGSDTDAYDAGAVGVTPLVLDLFRGDDVEVAARIAAHAHADESSPKRS